MGREGRGEPLSAFIEKSAPGCAATVAFVWENGDFVNLWLGPTVHLRLRDTAHTGVHLEGIPKPCRLLSELPCGAECEVPQPRPKTGNGSVVLFIPHCSTRYPVLVTTLQLHAGVRTYL